jgi:hypothetical protein
MDTNMATSHQPVVYPRISSTDLDDLRLLASFDTAGEVSASYAAALAAISRATGVIRVFAREVSRNQSPSRRTAKPAAVRRCPRWTRARPLERGRRRRVDRLPREVVPSMPALPRVSRAGVQPVLTFPAGQVACLPMIVSARGAERRRPHMSQVSTSRDAAAPARRRVRQARRTEAANPGAGRSRRRTAVPSRRRRTVWAAWRAESPSAHGRSVTSASRQGGRAGGPGVGKRARKAASGHRLSRSSATRRSRWPLGKAARATRAVSEGRGSMGLGRRLVHLHVYTRNLRDAEASSQCSKDFASSISFGDEGRRGHTSVGAGQEWWMTSAGSCRR